MPCISLPFNTNQFSEYSKLLMRQIFLLILVFVGFMTASAADDKAVSGTYTYYGYPGMTMLEAREKALAGAQTEALREAFGTLVTQDVVQNSEIINDREMQNFLSSTQSTVRGEWLGTTGTPEYEENYVDGAPVVTCRVSGRGRKLSNNAPSMKVSALKTPDKRAAATSFLAEENIYMYVQSPESDVYIMICLEDNQGTVCRLFPYLDTNVKSAKLKKGYDYILFDPARKSEEFGTVDSFRLTANNGLELDRIYLLYSPNYFRKGPWIHISDDEPEIMSVKDFNKWMLELRRADEEMGMQVINVSVRPEHDSRYEEE